jgi:hypothetical protein
MVMAGFSLAARETGGGIFDQRIRSCLSNVFVYAVAVS